MLGRRVVTLVRFAVAVSLAGRVERKIGVRSLGSLFTLTSPNSRSQRRDSNMPISPKFRHVVFPRQRHARLVDLALPDDVGVPFAEQDIQIPSEQWAFAEWLLRQAGLNANSYRAETLSRRLSACLRFLRVESLADARSLLEDMPHLISGAVSSILVGVTSFFRDPHLFETLQKEILPTLAEPRGTMYAWSIGCSSGEELYSLAFLMADLGLLHGSYLLGTDCRPEAIEQAKLGSYNAGALSGIPAPMRARYLVRYPSSWQVIPNIRGAVRWRVSNILGQREPGLWDLIFCRNTSIYLRSQASRCLWEQLEGSLRVGGVLVLGKAERPIGAKRLHSFAPCLFRKTRR